MFKESLQQCVESTAGAQGSVVMDLEGITLASYQREGAVGDVEAVGAEASVIVRAIQRAGEMLDAGDTQEISFQSDKLVTLIRVLSPAYFVAMTLTPAGNLGQGRFALRVAAPELARALG